MTSHKEFKAKLLKNPNVKREYDALCLHLKTTIIDDKRHCVECGEEVVEE